MNWTLVIFGAAAALLAGGLFLWRRPANGRNRKSGDAPDNLGEPVNISHEVNMVQRMTGRFPAILRSTPDPSAIGNQTNAGLQGNLGQTPLHDLLQYLALGRKSGILELVSGRRTGRIILKEGRIYKNSYRGKDGLEALYLMLDLSDGDFEFYEQNMPDLENLASLEVVDIIMLWMERKPKKKA